jgi:Ca2+-binding RTX toxin-like protein
VSQSLRRRGCALAIFASALALLAFAPGAFAATLSVDGSGNVVFTAGASETNLVAFDETDATTVEVTQAVSQGDDSTITPDGTDCVVDTAGAPGEDNTFTCSNVTGGVIGTAFDGNDTLDASGGYTGGSGLTSKSATFDGGDGGDNLIGGFSADVIHGGNGDDNVMGESGPGSGGNDQLFGDAGDDSVAGGPGNDTVDGGADGDDNVVGGPGTDTVTGGDGNDGFVAGGPGNDTVDGGAGNDSVYGDCDGGPCSGGGTPGNDTVTGGDGNDDVHGEQGNDTVSGGAGSDTAAGGPGTDVVSGGDGSDNYVAGGPGNDTVDGGAGDDYVVGDCGGYNVCGNGADGNDTVTGGSGNDFSDADGGTDTIDLGLDFDTVAYQNRITVCDPSCHTVTHPVSVTLDGVANDGAAGENDNVLGTEDVNITGCCGTTPPPGSATIVGDAGTNQIRGGDGNDSIDGGAGNDFLNGNAGDDVINANDGFADRVDCGDGNDIANVDEFDAVNSNCETVNRTVRGHLATEDAPPTVAWIAPADGAKMSTSAANTLTVNATDDKGISQVVFLAGERVICAVKTAPYTCAYKPTDADVGRTTLSAIAYDTSQQTASALRVVTVPRFTPKSVTFKTTPKSDTSAPFTFRTKGKVNLPAGVTKARGCNGTVLVTFKAGAKTISARRAKVSSSCAFSSKVTFTIPSRLHPSSLKVHATFRGNAVLSAKGSKNSKVKV